MRLAVLLAAIAWSLAAAADTRTTLDLAAISSSPSFAVHGDFGLAGVHDGAPLPDDLPTDYSESKCLRHRRASVGADTISEVVTIGGREYLDTATLDTWTDKSRVTVTSHERRLVTRIATLGEIGVWAWREAGALHFGAFADFGEMSHAMTSFGCRWVERTIPERGGTAVIVSEPSMSDPPFPMGDPPRPKATGPSFSIAISVSRSSTDGRPLVVMRTR